MGKNYAIILAGGTGSRMESDMPKQYLELLGRPVLYYSLDVFSKCEYVDGIILVVGSFEEVSYCRTEIIDRYHIGKVEMITVGGAERYESVSYGLRCIEGADYVMIHDSARCLIDEDTIRRTYMAAREHGAAVAAVPVKDTIKKGDPKGFAAESLNRDELWQIQTPQTFKASTVTSAYKLLMSEETLPKVTDDAMVVERYSDKPVKLAMGSYENIKITTPGDMIIAEAILSHRGHTT